MFTRILAGPGGDLRSQEVRRQPVFVCRPDRAIAPEEGRSRTLLAAEADRAIDESFHEPLEAHRNFDQPSLRACCYAIDHAAADEGLADSDRGRPRRAVGEQVADRDGKVMVR